jgi:hypothetical protein
MSTCDSAPGSTVAWSVGWICVLHMSGSFAGKISRFTSSSACARSFSATITPLLAARTSDCAVTTSSGAIVPTLTRISFSWSSFFASCRFFCAAAQVVDRVEQLVVEALDRSRPC